MEDLFDLPGYPRQVRIFHTSASFFFCATALASTGHSAKLVVWPIFAAPLRSWGRFRPNYWTFWTTSALGSTVLNRLVLCVPEVARCGIGSRLEGRKGLASAKGSASVSQPYKRRRRSAIAHDCEYPPTQCTTTVTTSTVAPRRTRESSLHAPAGRHL